MLKKLKLAFLGLFAPLMAFALDYDDTTSSFTGSIDLTPYYSALTIVLTVIAVLVAVRLGMGLIRRGR
jgi:hypothetical protein